jgi:transcriptional regulator with XRE-family HTH domain
MKAHNAFTNREVELIRKHWPTLMPMEELLALLPRHTENSVTGYANKKLGLVRPTRRNAPGNPRKQPAWERLRELLESAPLTQVEIAAAMGFTRTRASELLRAHAGEVYVSEWNWPEDGIGRAESKYALGNKPNAPEPIGEQRLRRIAVKQANPFAVAAGLVKASEGQPGRVYINLLDEPEEIAA